MSLNIPKSAMGICFMRGQAIRSVASNLYAATVLIDAGRIKDASIVLGVVRMDLETIAQVSSKKDANKAKAIRKEVIKTSKMVASKGDPVNKAIFVSALSYKVQKLESSLAKSCRSYP